MKGYALYSVEYPVEGIPLIKWEDFIRNIEGKKEIALDTETIADLELASIQIAVDGVAYLLVTHSLGYEKLRTLGQILLNKTLIGVNLKFDLKVLLINIPDFTLDVYPYDLMLVEQIISAEDSASLAAMASKYLGVKYRSRYKVGRKKYAEGVLFEDYVLDKDIRLSFQKDKISYLQALYGLSDAIFTLEIYKTMSEKFSRLIEENKAIIDLENKFLLCIVEMELNGMPLDLNKWSDSVNELSKEISKVLTRLKEYADINWNSPAQVLRVLKDKRVLDDEASSVAKTSISSIDNDIVSTYLEYKHLTKLYTAYGVRFYEYVDTDSRVRSSFWQIVSTGRMSSSKPNLQNIPREGKYSHFRTCFTAPKDRVFVISDYSGQEFKILVDFCRDKSLIEMMNSGKDPHRYVASKIFSTPEDEISSEQRYKAKTINFTIAYGGSASTVASRLNISIREAQRLIDDYYNSFPSIRAYFQNKLKKCLDSGYISTSLDCGPSRNIYIPFYARMMQLKRFIDYFVRSGRKLFIPKKVLSEYSKLYQEFVRKTQNYPIQGTAANMTKLAAIEICSRLKHIPSARLNLIIHDEFIVECDSKDADTVCQIVRDSMEWAAKQFCPYVDIKADPIVSKIWAKG